MNLTILCTVLNIVLNRPSLFSLFFYSVQTYNINYGDVHLTRQLNSKYKKIKIKNNFLEPSQHIKKGENFVYTK